MTLPIPPAVLEVVNAAVRFGEVHALDGVSLSFHLGECIGLVGHNGAGKSTIVSVINGGLPPPSRARSSAMARGCTPLVSAWHAAGV